MTREELDGEQHAISALLLDLARRGNVGFVLLLFNGKGEVVTTSNMTDEQKREFVGTWLNEQPTEASYHRVQNDGGKS